MISPKGEIHGIPKINMDSGLVPATGFPLACIPSASNTVPRPIAACALLLQGWASTCPFTPDSIRQASS